MKMNINDIKTIDIITKMWRDKTFGNNYFAARVTLNYGEDSAETLYIDFQYGDDDVAEQEARKLILGEQVARGTHLYLWCEDRKIPLRRSTHTDCKQRDVKWWGTNHR